MRIGVFDSGVGGLTVLHEALKLLPDEEYHYYADVDHVPYGEKSVEEIRAYSEKAVSFLAGKNCDAVVVACNTATSAAVRILREKFDFPLIGIEPAVKPAIEQRGNGRILVIATPLTVREKKLHDLIARFNGEGFVDLIPLPGLVGFAERGVFETEEVRSYLDSAFEGTDTSVYSVLVYGCTHFYHFAHLLRDYFPQDIRMLDGSEGTARNLARTLMERGVPTAGSFSIRFYRSGREVTDGETLAFYRGLMDHLDHVS